MKRTDSTGPETTGPILYVSNQSVHGLAYHSMVNALEARTGWTNQRRFVSSIRHCIHGHMPYERYFLAGQKHRSVRSGEGQIEQLMQDWIATDVNPAFQLLRSCSSFDEALRFFNIYNSNVDLGVRTLAVPKNADVNAPRFDTIRTVRTVAYDNGYCRTGCQILLKIGTERVARNMREKVDPAMLSLSEVADDLGVKGSASAEVARVFETEGAVSVGRVAQRIGCHQRTLERRLRHEGLTAEMIKMAVRLIHATHLMRGPNSLTDIAAEVGFSDQAHMTRSFRQACGMSPNMFRSVSAARFRAAA